jgi:hypothetical protein
MRKTTMKACPGCGKSITGTKQTCPHCGHVFPTKVNGRPWMKDLGKSPQPKPTPAPSIEQVRECYDAVVAEIEAAGLDLRTELAVIHQWLWQKAGSEAEQLFDEMTVGFQD